MCAFSLSFLTAKLRSCDETNNDTQSVETNDTEVARATAQFRTLLDKNDEYKGAAADLMEDDYTEDNDTVNTVTFFFTFRLFSTPRGLKRVASP